MKLAVMPKFVQAKLTRKVTGLIDTTVRTANQHRWSGRVDQGARENPR